MDSGVVVAKVAGRSWQCGSTWITRSCMTQRTPSRSIPMQLAHPPKPIPRVNTRRFISLARSGMRNTPGLLWFALNADPGLGRLALGVLADGVSYQLLAECPTVTLDLLGRAAPMVMGDHRAHSFSIRPTTSDDPALGDTRIVIPIRRDATAPRSPATLLGDALPLSTGFDLEPREVDEIREVALAEGAVRASLAYVESRSLIGEHRPIGTSPRVDVVERRLIESRQVTLMFADGTPWQAPGGLEHGQAIDAALRARLAGRAPQVAVTDLDDPLLNAAGYSMVLI